jgi:S-(hydroxymethyl)glutathione dehydrogenase/alcohol dehydrogenase
MSGGAIDIRAAVLRAPNEPLDVTTLTLDAPKRDEVRVRLLASGICRSDLSYIDGKWPMPLPMVLGHEGAGVIEAVGQGVDPNRIGEEVVLTFSPPCGACRFCFEGRSNLCSGSAYALDHGVLRDGTTRLSESGSPVFHLALVASFATHTVCPANAAIPIPPGLSPLEACLLGCGVTTGVLSVTQRARVRPGDSVAIFACGGVGLSAVQGARLVSAFPIIAVDPVAEKRSLSMMLGATHIVDPADGDPVEQIRSIVSDGVDYAFDCLGYPEISDQAFRSVREGGTTTLIGQPAMSAKAGFSTYDVTQFEHTILGSNLGGGRPPLDIPRLARLVEAERLDVESLVTHVFDLDDINEAIVMTNSGQAGRVVIDLRDGA